MSTSRRLAVSYSRFSDPKQAKGDSEDRQERLFRQFCEHHNLTPLAEVFADRGRSGYKGEHVKKGRLGQLVEMAKDGRFEPGTVVVVEAWDRLGRLRPDGMIKMIRELVVDLGLGIGICRINQMFVEEDFAGDKWMGLAAFVQMAFQESKQKAERVAASWKMRRAEARDGAGALNQKRGGCLRLGPLPGWLESIDGLVRPIPDRAAAIKRIFQLATSGYGHTRIVQTLTAEKVPPFGEVRVNDGRMRSQYAGKWTKPYVALLLRDRRVLGEFQPYKNVEPKKQDRFKKQDQENAEPKQEYQPDGPPLAGFYPAVITERQFLLARAGQGARRLGPDKSDRGNMARESKYVNTFRGLLRHARDDEGWVLHNKGTGARPDLMLVNAKGNGGRGGPTYTFPYFLFEDAVIGRLKELTAEEVFPSAEQEATRADDLRAQLERAGSERLKLHAAQKAKGYSEDRDDLITHWKAEEERIGLALQEELTKTIMPLRGAWKHGRTVMGEIKAKGDEARLKLRPFLQRCIDSIWLLIVPRGSYRICHVQIMFAGNDTPRIYGWLHQTKANGRAGYFERMSDRSTPLAGAGFDLRNPKDAAKVTKILATIDDWKQLISEPSK